MHLCQRFFQSSKHLLNSISGIASKGSFDSACISPILSKRCPLSGLLSLGNSQKSHGVKSGEYGRCGTICVEFLAKWSRRTSAVWDGALSWCKTTSCLPKISFEIVLNDSLEMPIVSARSLNVNRRFLWTNSLNWLTCCSTVDADGRPGRSKSSTRSLPSLKSFYHL